MRAHWCGFRMDRGCSGHMAGRRGSAAPQAARLRSAAPCCVRAQHQPTSASRQRPLLERPPTQPPRPPSRAGHRARGGARRGAGRWQALARANARRRRGVGAGREEAAGCGAGYVGGRRHGRTHLWPTPGPACNLLRCALCRPHGRPPASGRSQAWPTALLPDLTACSPQPPTSPHLGPGVPDAPVTADEEALVRRLFEANIRTLCEAYPLPPKVTVRAGGGGLKRGQLVPALVAAGLRRATCQAPAWLTPPPPQRPRAATATCAPRSARPHPAPRPPAAPSDNRSPLAQSCTLCRPTPNARRGTGTLCCLPLSSASFCPCRPLWQATAVSYFKRFYVRRSMLEYDPSRVAPTCIYLAAKARARRGAGAAGVAAVCERLPVLQRRRPLPPTHNHTENPPPPPQTRLHSLIHTCQPLAPPLITPPPLRRQVEEAYVGAEDFCRQLKIDPQLVLRTEVRPRRPPGGGGRREGAAAACPGAGSRAAGC